MSIDLDEAALCECCERIVHVTEAAPCPSCRQIACERCMPWPRGNEAMKPCCECREDSAESLEGEFE